MSSQYEAVQAEAEKEIASWCRDHGCSSDCLFVKQLRDIYVSPAIISAILEIIGDICNSCWNAPTDCQCWNEE